MKNPWKVKSGIAVWVGKIGDLVTIDGDFIILTIECFDDGGMASYDVRMPLENAEPLDEKEN